VEVLHVLVWEYPLLFPNSVAALLGNLEGCHWPFANVVLGLGVRECCWQVEVLHILVSEYHLLFANGGAALLGNLEGFHYPFANGDARFGCTGTVMAGGSFVHFGPGIPSAVREQWCSASWKLGRLSLAVREWRC